jgi:DNA-binding NtrC family response regulator
MSKQKVLVVDDEPSIRFALTDYLGARGFEVEAAETANRAQEVFVRSPPDVAVIDYMLPDGTALDLLPRLREAAPVVPIVVLTAHGSIDLAVRCIKEGAQQFLTKPLEMPALLVILERVLEQRRNERKLLVGTHRRERARLDPFVGVTPAIRSLAEQTRRVVDTDTPVLIQGETGTGKNILARWLHERGPRSEEAFVDVNCAALSPEFLQAELFGYEPGAFTGATSRKLGLLEVGHHGTVLLDEVGDIDLSVQPKLLKVIEERRFRRLGSVRDIEVDIRLLSASNSDLAHLVEERRFRSDLFFRLDVVHLACPPLRQRREDIPILARDMLERLATDRGTGEIVLSAAAERLLMAYAWPGNLRELRNVLERAALLARRPVLEAGDFVLERPGPEAPAYVGDAELSLEQVERLHIERVLQHEGGNVGRAAQCLRVPRSSLYQKLKKYGINLSKF